MHFVRLGLQVLKETFDTEPLLIPLPGPVGRAVDHPLFVCLTEFVPRGITGKKAEKAFEEFHSVSKKPFPGKLLDRRDDGCGYDYELITNNSSKYIEVKGLAGNEGGMSFTAKEWEMAQKHQDDYFVVLVKNVGNEPSFYIYQNPHSNLQPKKHLIQTVQIRWNISANQI